VNFPYATTTLTPGSFPNYTWTVAGLAAIFDDGYQYNIETRAQDFAGNFEVAYNTTTFIVDLSSPAAAIVYPSSGGYISQAGAIQGTVADLLIGGNVPSGPQTVQVRISSSPTSFWNGSGWVGN